MSRPVLREQRWKTEKENKHGGEDNKGRRKWITHEKGGGSGWEKRQGDGRESKMRRKREEEKDRERRDSQSMKPFDNLVILLLKSIPPSKVCN